MTKGLLTLFLCGAGWGAGNTEFSHYQHVKTEELQCSDCHDKTMGSRGLEDLAPVSDKTCIKCHDDDSGFTVVRPLVMTDLSFKIHEKSEKGSLKFSHKTHGKKAGMECARCHGEVLDVGAAAPAKRGPNPLAMKSCMECHVKKAEISCLTCHDEVEKPLNHLSVAWLRSEGHGLASNLKGQDCEMCHEQTGDCAECHMGTDARKVHGLNYRFNHGTDVRFGKSDCSVCHQPLDQFCADCHEGVGGPAR